jgi:putative ABC transport system permease protein
MQQPDKPAPPKFARRFLMWFCPPGLYEAIEGDLVEAFRNDVTSMGITKARRRFAIRVLRFFRPGIIFRNRFSFRPINMIMLESYFKIAYRNLLKHKGYSFINIFGLSVGIACCLIMFNYVSFELSFDNYHPDGDRTFRVDRELNNGASSSSAPPLAQALKTNYPEVEDAMRVNTPGDYMVRYADGPDDTQSFNENRVFAADPNFFSFFGFQLREGNPLKALEGVNKVVISADVAKKFFGDSPALGKILLFGDQRRAVEVTGVTDSQPANTHFHFDYLLSMETIPEVKKRDWSWVWIHMVTYVRLKPGTSSSELESKLPGLSEKVIRPAFEARGMDFKNTLQGKDRWTFILRPLGDIHLKSGDNRIGPVGNIRYAVTFAIVGAFVLLIASINFINLSTARGTNRAKEVGVKKALGALRSSLVSQFQSESILLTLISTAFSLVVAKGLSVLIARLVGIEIPFTLWNDQRTMIIILVLPFALGIVAGLYPAFYLTAFRPIQVLKGKIAAHGGTGLRNGLVILQFTISIALIAGTMIVFQQLRFLGSATLGFNKENVLLIKYAEKLGNQLESFRNEIESFQGVTEAGITMEVPGGGIWTDDFQRENSSTSAGVAIVKIDEPYWHSMGFELVTGRTFEKERPSDKNAVIPNETTVMQLGLTPQEALGQFLIYPGNNNTRHEIIGVMKDFHYQSLHTAITPVMFCRLDCDIWGDWRTLTIKFKDADISDMVRRINQSWNKVLNDTPMSYSFLDQDLDSQYRSEKQLGSLFSIFSGLSILIAVIGLVGLVSYSAEVRKKEIGIRKVFGASTGSILLMMNSRLIRLIAIAFAISIPFSWWALATWLDSFAYRIEISPVTFVLAGIGELALALLSVGYLSFRSASLNPAKVLKEEG